MFLFHVAAAAIFLTSLRVGPSKFEQPQVGLFVVGVTCDGFKPLKHQALTHRSEVVAQGVEHVHAVGRSQITVFHEFSVRRLGQRIGHDFGEPQADQQLTPAEQHVFAVGLGGNLEGAGHAFWQGHVVKAVDAEHLLGNVRRAGDVAAVGWHVEGPEVFFARHHLDVKGRQDGRQARLVDGRAEEPKQPRQLQFHRGVLHAWRPFELDGPLDFCTCPRLQESHAALGGQAHGPRVDAAFESEAGIGAQRVTFGGFAHGHWMEPCGFEQHGSGAFTDPAVRAAVDPCETHGGLVVGDDKVFHVQFPGLIVQGHQGLFGRGFSDDHLATFNLGEVERVQRIAKFMQHQVRGVHHVVDGLHPNGAQLLLGPVWAGRHRDVVQLHGEVMRAVVLGLHIEGDAATLGQGRVQGGGLRKGQRSHVHGAHPVDGAVHQSGPQVAGHPPMPHGIVAVGRQANFNDVVSFQADELRQGLSHLCSVIKHEDAVVACPKAQFVFGTNHAQRHLASDFSFLDFEGVTFRGVKRASHRGHGNLLSFGHIARTTHDVKHVGSDVHLATPKAVCIGVRCDGGDMAHDNSRESAWHVFDVFHALHFEACGRQDLGRLFDGNVKRKQLLDPTG